MFWSIFYWFGAGGFFTALFAHQFFGWQPSAEALTTATLLIGGVAFHSMARQKH